MLVDAVAAGRPVVATAFPHAVELLASGAGLVVPRRDPDGARRRAAPGAHRARARRRHGRRGAPARARRWPGRRSPRRYAALGDALRRSPGGRGVVTRPRARLRTTSLAHDRRLRHLRARRPRRRLGPSTATAPTTWPALLVVRPASRTRRRVVARAGTTRVPLPRRRTGLDRQHPEPTRRRTAAGTGRRGVEDCWGGASGRSAPRPPSAVRTGSRQDALAVLRARRRADGRPGRGRWPSPRSAPPRSSRVAPGTPRRSALLADAADARSGRPATTAWPWPEPASPTPTRVLPEALIAAGTALGPARRSSTDGLDLLRLAARPRDRRRAPVGDARRRRRDRTTTRRGFDQQPIEVATLADACARGR